MGWFCAGNCFPWLGALDCLPPLNPIKYTSGRALSAGNQRALQTAAALLARLFRSPGGCFGFSIKWVLESRDVKWIVLQNISDRRRKESKWFCLADEIKKKRNSVATRRRASYPGCICHLSHLGGTLRPPLAECSAFHFFYFTDNKYFR